jgi:hypothetical protein
MTRGVCIFLRVSVVVKIFVLSGKDFDGISGRARSEKTHLRRAVP